MAEFNCLDQADKRDDQIAKKTKSYYFFFLFSDNYSLVPQVHEPEKEIIKEAIGEVSPWTCFTFINMPVCLKYVQFFTNTV